MGYSKQIDWKINSSVKQELVRLWIDVSKIVVSTTKGVVDISGAVNFTGAFANEKELANLVNKLKSADTIVRSIYGVRDVRWKLKNWTKTGNTWSRAEK